MYTNLQEEWNREYDCRMTNVRNVCVRDGFAWPYQETVVHGAPCQAVQRTCEHLLPALSIEVAAGLGLS